MGSEQKRALIAVLISGIFLFGWQKLYSPVDNSINQNKPVKESEPLKAEERYKRVESPVDNNFNGLDNTVIEKNLEVGKPENLLTINNYLSVKDFYSENSIFNFKEVVGESFNSQFFILKNGSKIPLIVDFSLSTDFGYQSNIPGVFASVVGTENGPNIRISSNEPIILGIDFRSSSDKTENGSFRKLKTYKKGEVGSLEFGDNDSLISESQWFAIDHKYHVFALVGEQQYSFNAKSHEDGLISIQLSKPSKVFDFNFIYTKKNYDYLMSLKNGLNATIEFGFFGFLAIPILRMLQFFYEYFPNYGVAIILLTLIIRLLTFPLQYKSFKSMKKMQKLQPELNKLKEKYQDNPQKMQAETMELFKKSGANPLGGCLSMLL